MKPLLSVGIIFKNEIRCLERCLEALRPLKAAIPMEIVMADTGSSDGSREVAAQYADVLFDFPWIDDFSAARNAVMDRCSGKWYLSLDADEVLDPDVRELVAFLHSPAADQAQMSYLVINNYTDANDMTQFVPFQALRLVNMSTGARFAGKIHEKVQMKEGFAACNLVHTQLWHDGYLKQDGKSKDQKKMRNLPLIQEALAKAPNDPTLLMQALESSYTKEQAAEYAGRIVELIHSGENPRPTLEPVLWRDAVKVACVHELPRFRDWITEAMDRCPDSPYIRIDVCYYAVSMALRSGDWATVARCGQLYREATATFDSRTFNATMGAVWSATKDCAETVELALANAGVATRDWESCRAILEAHPLKTIGMQNAMLWFSAVFNNTGHMDLTEVFRKVGADFFGEDTQPDAEDREKMKVFLNACRQMFLKAPQDAPYYLLVALGDCEVGWWARVMTVADDAAVREAGSHIGMWRAVPPVVLEKLAKAGFSLPQM